MGQDIYWINGKAGSGKSTLTKFICEHDKTNEALRTWAALNEVQILSYFFWRPAFDAFGATRAIRIRTLVAGGRICIPPESDRK